MRSGLEARASASLRGYVTKHPGNPGLCLTSTAPRNRSTLGLGLDWPLGTADPRGMVRGRGAGGPADLGNYEC